MFFPRAIAVGVLRNTPTVIEHHVWEAIMFGRESWSGGNTWMRRSSMLSTAESGIPDPSCSGNAISDARCSRGRECLLNKELELVMVSRVAK